jgi:hypothetical protein
MPTSPFGLMVKIVPPVPTFNPFPTVKIPTELLKVKLEDVAKSFDSLNKISPLFPGGETVTVTATPAGGPTVPVALIAFPTKLS